MTVERLFVRILQMSLAGGIVILAVLLMRLILRRAPGKYRYLLWIVPAFRLCVPVSLPSSFSLFRLLAAPVSGGADYTPKGLTMPLEDALPAAGTGITSPAGTAAQQTAAAGVSWISVLAWAWAAVLAALLIYGLISGLLLRRRLATAVRLEGRVYQASGIDTPFLLGLFRPRIYIPWGMEGKDLRYALAHEACHLRRGDPWWRFLAWLLLCVHWFNPLCWLAWFLMGRDMELSCDESVLERTGDVRREYSESLLHIASKQALSSPPPLAFAETGVNSRVRNVLRWKKAKGWITATAVILCVLFTAAWVTDPSNLSAGSVTLNPDGTVGNLHWGMSPEEAQAADSRIVISSIYKNGYYQDNYVFAELNGVQVLGHTADLFLSFPKRIADNKLRRDKTGTPILEEIRIYFPGEVEVKEALTELFGEQERYMVGDSWEFVDGKPVIHYRPYEISEDHWYWHAQEMATDLIPVEQLRLALPAGWKDEEVLGTWCSTFAWKVYVNKIWIKADSGFLYDEYFTEEDNKEELGFQEYTEIIIDGLGLAMQKFLKDVYQQTEEG